MEEINKIDLDTQLQEIYECEKKLEENRNNRNFNLIKKQNILTRMN